MSVRFAISGPFVTAAAVKMIVCSLISADACLILTHENGMKLSHVLNSLAVVAGASAHSPGAAYSLL